MLNNYKLFVESASVSRITSGEKITDQEDYAYRERAWLKFQRAATMIANKYTFFGDLLYQLGVFITHKDEKRITTMATDGFRILINPRFILEDLTIQETVFVVVHEIMHCVLQHMSRRGDRDSTKWNYAGDYVINILLNPHNKTDDKVGEMPKSALWDATYENLSTDVVYDMMKNDPKFKKDEEEKEKKKEPKGPPKPPREPEVGDYIRIKKTKGFGKITKVNSDGSIEHVVVTKEEVDKNMKNKEIA